MSEVYKQYGLGENTIDFLGHAIALQTSDDYLEEPAIGTIQKMKQYLQTKSGDSSPFLYPTYGLGGLPEAFLRICSNHGGTSMLNTDVDQILFGDGGKVTGIVCGDQLADAPIIICDPSYTTAEQTKEAGKVIRAICIMDHPIPETADAQSIQIILPAKQLKRKTDTYISMASNNHLVCKKGLYVAIISATVETENPEQEIQPALALLGGVLEMFVSVSPIYETKSEQGDNNNLWITSSYDAASHFESATEEILQIYERITGEKLDLSNIEPDEQTEEFEMIEPKYNEEKKDNELL